jgi:hypothetical protein
MPADIETQVDKAREALEPLCSPSVMSVEEAIEFYENVISDCRTTIAALREDLD